MIVKEKIGRGFLYFMDVLEGLKLLLDNSQDLIIVDPPYYKTVNEKWDKQWKTEKEYLDWCRLWFAECVRVLKDTGSFYCYGNFDILSKQKVLIFDDALNFRQNITLNKGLKSIAGRTSDKLRMFPTASEYLVFYTKQEMWFETPFSIIMKRQMKEKGLTQIDISKLILSRNGNLTGWVHNKIKGIQLPTAEQWNKICNLFEIKNEYDLLCESYEEQRFTFNLPTGQTDVWDFTPDKVRFGNKTQKPQDISRRIIKASSNEEQSVLIPFAGSGSECEACEVLGRNWTAFENDQFSIDIIHERFKNLKAFEKSKERGLFSFTDEQNKAD